MLRRYMNQTSSLYVIIYQLRFHANDDDVLYKTTYLVQVDQGVIPTILSSHMDLRRDHTMVDAICSRRERIQHWRIHGLVIIYAM